MSESLVSNFTLQIHAASQTYFTAIGCFIPTVVIFFLGIAMISGMIVGGIAGAKAGNTTEAADVGRIAGEQFGRNFGAIIFFLSMALAAITALVLTFGGILPWCRKPREQNTPQSPAQY